MSSKTSGKMRFWGWVMLLGLAGLASGCGDGSGDNGGPGAGGSDTNPPGFSGLSRAEVNSNADVVLSAPEASDTQTSGAEMTYLIFVSTTPSVNTTGDPSYTFPGTQCTGGQCTFTITNLAKDGSTTYFFGSRAQDKAGNRDQDAHPTEGNLSLKPNRTVSTLPPPGGGGGGGGTGGSLISSSSLNVDKGKHAVHPSLAVIGNTPVAMWEECTPDPFNPNAPAPNPAPTGWEKNHPCSTETPAQVYIRQGANWDLVKDPALGRDDLTVNSSRHAHDPAVTLDGTNIYASWREIQPASSSLSTIFVKQFSGTGFSTVTNTNFPDTAAFRPALTRHTALGGDLGIAYEFSPTNNRQVFFRQLTGNTWSGRSPTLNTVTGNAGEAPQFSKKGTELYVTWKEATQPLGRVPNIFVKKLVGGSWQQVGPGTGSLNINPANEARFPSIDVLPTTQVPYVAWHECLEVSCDNEHIFVKHFDGNTWVPDKDTSNCPDLNNCIGSLNHKSKVKGLSNRFAETPSLAVHNNQVYVAWSERDAETNLFVIQVKRLEANGTWTLLSLPVDLFVRNARFPILIGNGALYIAWIEENDQGILQMVVATLQG